MVEYSYTGSGGVVISRAALTAKAIAIQADC